MAEEWQFCGGCGGGWEYEWPGDGTAATRVAEGPCVKCVSDCVSIQLITTK